MQFLLNPTPGTKFAIKGLAAQTGWDMPDAVPVNFGKKPYDWLSETQWQNVLVRQRERERERKRERECSFVLLFTSACFQSPLPLDAYLSFHMDSESVGRPHKREYASYDLGVKESRVFHHSYI